MAWSAPKLFIQALEMLNNGTLIRIFDPIAEKTSREQRRRETDEPNSAAANDKLDLMDDYSGHLSLHQEHFHFLSFYTHFVFVSSEKLSFKPCSKH